MPATLAENYNDIINKYGDEIDIIYKDKMREPFLIDGYSYKGVMLRDKIEDKVMCHDCGKLLKVINNTHLKTHNYETADEYKMEHGLALYTPLCGISYSRKMSETMFKTKVSGKSTKSNLPLKPWNSGKKIGNRCQPISKKNRHGTCSDAQIKRRLEILASLVNRSPTQNDAIKFDKGLHHVLQHNYGSWNKGKEKLGFDVYKKGQQEGKLDYEDNVLIAILRKYVVDSKKIPKAKDMLNPFPSSSTYITRFGSWRRAKMMAGLDQLLEEVKNSSD